MATTAEAVAALTASVNTLTDSVLASTAFLHGTGAPSNALGKDGQFYYDQSVYAVYGPKAAGVWPTPPMSLAGPTGATGATGANGKTVLSGSGVPGAGVGTDGDFYLDTTAHNFYGPKAAGAWGAGFSLIGPQGPQGIQGIQGIQGPAGASSAPGGVSGQLQFNSAGAFGGSLLTQGANLIEQLNGANAQSFRLYNTYTDAANYERAVFDWSTTANTLTIGTQKGTTGTARNIDIVVGGVRKADYGITQVSSWAFQDVLMAAAYLQIGTSGSFQLLENAGNFVAIANGNGSNGYLRYSSTAFEIRSGMVFGFTAGAYGGANITTDTIDTGISRPGAGIIAIGNGTAGNKTGVLQLGGISHAAPATKTAAYTATIRDHDLIFNGAGSITLTLPAAATYPGQEYYVKTIAAQTVVSATANIVPRAGGAATTALLAGVAGPWARIVSDGTNWVVMAGN